MRKWRLMLTTLPYVAAMLGLKLALEYAGWGGIVEFSDVGMVLTGGVFLLGFMLAGTMSDFKEAERLPAEIACALETLEETMVQATHNRPALDAAKLRATLLQVAEQIRGALMRRAERAQLFVALERVSALARELEAAGAGPYAGRSLAELHSLRKLLTRLHVISRTGFLASGYALLEVMTLCIFTLLLVSHFRNLISEITLVAFVSLIFTYMLRLIRDIDDPFEYGDDGSYGAGEVELFPLNDYVARLRQRASA